MKERPRVVGLSDNASVASPEAKFEAAAWTIADSPPEWLTRALAYFGPGITSMRDPFDIGERFVRMRDACDTLMKGLPAYLHMPFDLQTEETEAAKLVLQLLPTIKENLDQFTKSRSGRKPIVSRIICAAVIVEAWKLLHGKVERRSNKVYEACEVYWQACGGPASDIENWRRLVEKVSANSEEWIVKRLAAFRAVQN